MINEANASSSACRLWRIPQVETGAPPSSKLKYPLAMHASQGDDNDKKPKPGRNRCCRCPILFRDLLLHADTIEAGVAGKSRCVGKNVRRRGGRMFVATTVLNPVSRFVERASQYNFPVTLDQPTTTPLALVRTRLTLADRKRHWSDSFRQSIPPDCSCRRDPGRRSGRCRSDVRNTPVPTSPAGHCRRYPRCVADSAAGLSCTRPCRSAMTSALVRTR